MPYIYYVELTINVICILLRTKNPTSVDPGVVTALRTMIDEHNPIAMSYRMAAERIRDNTDLDVKLCLIRKRSRDGRMYNLPTCSDVVALIVGT